MTAALEGGEWSAARPGHTLPPEKTRYPFYRRLDVPQGRSGRAENLVPTGIRSRTVQPVVSRYADWATGPTSTTIKVFPFQSFPCSTFIFCFIFDCLELRFLQVSSFFHPQLHKTFLLSSFCVFRSVILEHVIRILSFPDSLLVFLHPTSCSVEFALAAYFPNLKVATIFFRKLRDGQMSRPRIH